MNRQQIEEEFDRSQEHYYIAEEVPWAIDFAERIARLARKESLQESYKIACDALDNNDYTKLDPLLEELRLTTI